MVSFLSTFVGSEPVSSIKRFDRKAKQKNEVPCPAVVKNYNIHMGGVDLLDAHVARYKIRVKSRKWYFRLFYHFVDLSIINAWLIWRRVRNENKSLAEFKQELALVLCGKGAVNVLGRGRPLNLQAKINKKKYKKKTGIPPIDTRTDRINHWPEFVPSRNRCRFPECTLKSSIKCSKCGIFLCLNAKNNCFVKYHTN